MLTAAEEMAATRDIRARAFGRLSDAEWEATLRRTAPVLAAGRQFAGFDGDRIVATGRIHDMTQWWHGRAVSTGGMNFAAPAGPIAVAMTTRQARMRTGDFMRHLLCLLIVLPSPPRVSDRHHRTG